MPMYPCDTTLPAPPTLRQRVLTVQAPGRLHLGFLDPGATLGRAFGSLGLVIDGFETRLELSAAAADAVVAAAPAMVRRQA